MPKIKLDYVVSFSSEDPNFPASNLLLNDPTKKWKSQGVGEKSVSVILQFEKASIISGIDIGNEHSAYIEVLAGRSSNPEEYKVLLVMSSFMTALESRQSQNTNKVRMFKQEDLSKPECNEKWDRIKIVCTQPFNRHVQYGLSFITFFTSNDKDQNVSDLAQNALGRFKLRPESPELNISDRSLTRRNEDAASPSVAIRQALESGEVQSCKPKLLTSSKTPSKNQVDVSSKDVSRNRNEILYDKSEEEADEKIEKIVAKRAKELKEEQEKEKEIEKAKQALKEKNKKDKIDSQKNKKDKNESPGTKKVKNVNTTPKTSDSKRKKPEEDNRKTPDLKRVKKAKQTRPFHKLLQDVVIVISGIQNPERAQLRTTAIAMGAKYKANWDQTCTHLICAFPNTPKFNQVKQLGGKIVKKEWLDECYDRRKRFPWRRFALDKNDANQTESEEEIWEETENSSRADEIPSSSSRVENSGNDTDEEIQKINSKNNELLADTDEEGDTSANQTNGTIKKTLPTFFKDKVFCIDSVFEKDIRKSLYRYICAYAGSVTDDPTDNLDIFITTESNSDMLKEINSSAICLLPQYVFECHKAQTLLPTDGFDI